MPKKFAVMIGRIKAVLAYSNMTETQFAKRLGVTQSSLNRVMRGATEISFKLVNAILTEFDEISAEWLMRGTGTMLAEDNRAADAKRIDGLVDVVAMQQEIIKNLQEKIKQLQNS
ncbi:helix-turn-helix transcriptional regulator [Bacteroidales bacterium Oil-RF-744-WCA-WT-10]|uniref:Helix-turn-helix transcriptional regulator n=2 Tax=Sodaliphilus pleomorphus TaxID=2606626 RepID=A0A6L5XC04_9BACT|nr:helix-turn-helix transcriptional regulator [Sodaliphilus pleomorphus]